MAHKISVPECHQDDFTQLEALIPASDLNKIRQREKKQLRKRLKPGMNVVDFKKTTIEPQTDKQRDLISSIRAMPQTITYGCAGTGKTYVPAAIAAEMFLEKKIGKIILTRPNVATGNSIGFFPGTLKEKMEPWVAPFLNVLREKLGGNVVECAMNNGNIEIVPLEIMRGRSFENAFVVLDEAQNCTLDELKCFVTRIGKGSKLVIDGDVTQTDLKKKSGFMTLIEMANRYPEIAENSGVIEFTVDDVVRSDICASWIKAFDSENL